MVKRNDFILFFVVSTVMICIVGISLLQNIQGLLQTGSVSTGMAETWASNSFTLALLSLVCIAYFLSTLYDQRLQRQRRSAASANQTFISYTLAPSTFTDVDISTLTPITFYLRWRNTLLTAAGGIVLLTVLIFSISLLWDFTLEHFSVVSHIDLQDLLLESSAIFILLWISWLTMLLIVRKQTLRASATGIWVNYFKDTKKGYIAYSDAHLFGVVSPGYYELSTAYGIAYWVRIHPDSMMSHFYKPSIPYSDFNQQMESIIYFISTKTGLPLYDLRAK